MVFTYMIKEKVMEHVLGILTGIEIVVLAGAAAVVGTIVNCTDRRRRRNLPEKEIEITVQRIDRPSRRTRR